MTIKCPHCCNTDLQKNGHSENGTQRWRCKGCLKSFQLSYTDKASEPGVKGQIDKLILNSAGVRDTARALSINKNTGIDCLKKKLSMYIPICSTMKKLKALGSWKYAFIIRRQWMNVGLRWGAKPISAGRGMRWISGRG